MASAPGTEEKHGLFPLYCPESYGPRAQDVHVDIVAIHGLGGHAFHTWTDEDGHLWLRDSLPRHIPQARIMTYGYDSAVVFAKSKMGVSDFALDLLTRLRLARMQPQEQTRPFIAICHSLGGVVFKEMLIQATLNSEQHGPIAQHIKGVVFLGTPHRGSRSASHAQLISRIINMATLGRGVRTELLRTLEVSASELEAISRYTVQLLTKFPIVSFYERKPLGPGLVVESFSAILGLPNERSVPINADHRKMARVSPRNENRYLPVWAAVKELAEAPAQPRPRPDMEWSYGHSELLDRLFCVDYTNAQLRSAQAHHGTCDWIFHDRAYLSWVHSGRSQLLLLSGGPGTGKSVMTRFLVEAVLSGSDQTGFPPGYQGVSFFCSYLEILQTGEETVLRSLLHQLLQLNPHAERLVKKRVQERTDGLSYSLDRQSLWDSLRDVLAMGTMGRTIIAIDALEELGSNIAVSILSGMWDIMSYLARERPRHQVRVFTSSRYNPTYTSAIPSLSVLRVPMRKVSDGIKIFLRDSVERLAATNTGFDATTDQDTRREIVDTISVRANGMFLWARIVWDDFQRGLLWNAAIVRQKLAKINTGPSSITGVYDELMGQIDPSVQDVVWSILSILSVAARPLRLDELAIVLSVSTADRRIVRSTDLDRTQDLDSVISDNLPDIITFHDDRTISFSHLSFKEYLRTTWTENFPGIFTRAERLVTRTCLEYINLLDLIEDASDGVTEMKDLTIKYPFLAYSRTYFQHHLDHMPPDDSLWLLFADLAGKPGPFSCGLLGNDAEGSIQGGFYRRVGSPLLSIIGTEESAKSPLTEILIRNFAAHGYDMNELWQGPDNAGWPLHWCCWRIGTWPGYGAIAILLLRHGADPRLPRGRFKTGIEYVGEAGRWDVFDVMVSHPRFDANQQDGRGRCVLHYLVTHATPRRLDRFLEDVSVDPNIQDIMGDTPLHLAASAGNTAVVRWLLNVPGIRLDLTDCQGRTPLGVSTYWGMRSTSLCFLKHSKAFPTPEEGQLSALCFAAKHGDLDLCLRLLEVCKYKRLHLHVDTSGSGILQLAAVNNWSDVLQQCLKKGDVHLNVNQIDHSGGTALHSAARLGSTESCRVLMEHGANLQLQDRLGRTAAQAAADAGFRDSLMVLLRSGRVDPNQQDHRGRNLVHWAATLDCVDVMELILAIPGVELARRDNDGAMPIDIAKRCMSARVGEYLGQEMQRRGIDRRWCVGFGWDMMYRSPEVTVQPEDEELEHQGMGPLGYRRQPNGFVEWEKIHRDYPEERWGLCIREKGLNP